MYGPPASEDDPPRRFDAGGRLRLAWTVIVKMMTATAATMTSVATPVLFMARP
jgi:hypothetical protein